MTILPIIAAIIVAMYTIIYGQGQWLWAKIILIPLITIWFVWQIFHDTPPGSPEPHVVSFHMSFPSPPFQNEDYDPSPPATHPVEPEREERKVRKYSV